MEFDREDPLHFYALLGLIVLALGVLYWLCGSTAASLKYLDDPTMELVSGALAMFGLGFVLGHFLTDTA
jgi:hypothetical protein